VYDVSKGAQDVEDILVLLNAPMAFTVEDHLIIRWTHSASSVGP
jgi:hypothetical protein